MSNDTSDRGFFSPISEKVFEAAFEASPSPTALSDLESGNFVHVNSAFTKCSGYSRDEIIGHSSVELGFWTNPIARASYIAKLQAGVPVTGVRVQLVQKTGDIRHMIFSAALLTVECKTYLLTVTHDITDQVLAEGTLRKAEEKYFEIFNATSDAIFVHDASSGLILDINKAVENMFGYSRDEILDGHFTFSDFSDGISPYSTTEAAEWARKAIFQGAQRFDWHARNRNGKLFWVEIAMHSTEIHGIGRILTFVRDISARKSFETALAINQKRLQALVDLGHMHNASLKELTDFVLERAVEITQSKYGNFAFVSDDEKTLTIHSWSRAALAKCNVKEGTNTYSIDEVGLWGEAIRQRKPVITNDYSAPNPFKRGCPEGHIPLKSHMSVPIFDNDKIVIIAGVANKSAPYDENDVMQLTYLMNGMWRILQYWKSQEALQESEIQYRKVLENIQDVFYRADLNGNLLFVSNSAARSLGFDSADEILGLPIHGFYKFPSDRQRLMEAMKKAGSVSDFEVMLKKKDGTPVWASTSSAFYRDSAGKVLGIEGILRDITERKKAEEVRSKLEEQLRQSMKMESIGRLAGGIAHDFSNLLTPILGYAESLLSELSPEDARRHSIMQIQYAALCARDLTRQLLAMGRKQVLELKRFDLRNIVTKFESLLKRTIREDIDIRISTAETPCIIKADVGQVEQVIMNLAVNAQDAMTTGGILRINVEEITIISASPQEALDGIRPGSYVMLSVSDTGCGIDEETKAHIFEPFFTTKEEGKGTGLGLATVDGIIEQHGGFMKVQSEMGKGTTFIVYFVKYTDANTAETPASITDISEARGETVLLVEDNEMVRQYTCTILQRLGYTPLTTKNAEECLAFVATTSQKIDLLLTDLVMPGMNGKQLYDQLRQRLPELKVVFMSGHPRGTISGQEALEDKSNFINKPFSITTLHQKIREALHEKTDTMISSG